MKKNIIMKYIPFILLLFVVTGCSDLLTYNPNRQPSAVVSQKNFTIYPGTVINLDASKSNDIDNQLIKFEWAMISQPNAGSPYSLANKDSDKAVFQTSFYTAGSTPYTVPNPSYLGTYTIRLNVYDEYNMADTQDINILVRNLSPTATILWTGAKPAPGSSVSLNGGTSVDPDPEKRNNLSFGWNVSDSPLGTVWKWNTGTYGTSSYIPVTVTDTTVDFAPGTLGANSGQGVYTVRLNVTDEYGATASQSVIIETNSNTAPTAAATVDVTNFGSPTVNAFTDVDTSPDVIQGLFVTGTGPLITLNGLPSNAGGASRNLEQDTLTYTWVIDGFTGSKSIQIGTVTRQYSPGDVLSTSSTFSFRLTNVADIVSEIGTAIDFTITLTVSDAAKSDDLLMKFDID